MMTERVPGGSTASDRSTPRLSRTEVDTLRFIRANHPVPLNPLADYLRMRKGWGVSETLLLLERMLRQGLIVQDVVEGEVRFVALPRVEA